MQKVEEHYQKSLSNTAKLYAGLGYSILPVYGDTQPHKAKIAAVSWKPYQLRRASDDLITRWFEQDKHGGIGIVTGRISNLIVIDFDDARLQHEFETQFSDLLKTRIVTSANRGLSHYYYTLPTYISIASKHITGADLLSNGCYVIAPPTVIDDNAYTITRGGMPYCLNIREAQRLEKFFDNRCQPADKVFSSIHLPLEMPDTQPTTHPAKAISSDSLVPLYQHYAPLIGRNNALFKVSCYARDYRMDVKQVAETLEHIHAQQMSYRLHPSESYEERLQEAQLTIKSAFRIPPRQLCEPDHVQLTNSIRESLLKRKLTSVARVLDGLFLKGFRPGDVITKKVVLDVLQDDVGRHSILTAFDTSIADAFIFNRVSVPPDPPSDTQVAGGKATNTKTKCYLFTPSKPDKNTRGRTAAQFYVPDLNVLCNLLGVAFTRSDPLTLEDIQQAKTYRQAVHREFIKRRPGMYHRYWLAKRIGVSMRTSQRYDRGAGVKRKPMFIYEPITWNDLNNIPADESVAGMFLEDEQGKRYPALRSIAARLLARKHRVRYGYQDKNYYWYGAHPPSVQVQYGINPRQAVVDAQREKTEQYLQQYWRDFHDKKHVQSSTPTRHQSATGANPITFQSPTVKYPSTLQTDYKQALSDSRAEALAKRLYRAVWDRAVNEKSRLSKVNARQLVETYGETLIKRALGVLKYRQNINNPAGFIIVWLRSTAKMVSA